MSRTTTSSRPGGPPATLRVDGEMPKVTFPDPLTVRYRWSKPNNLFLLDQAGAYPTIIFRPAHYLKQFHKAFNTPDALKKLARAEGRRNWAALHNKKDAMYLMDNPDMPTLQPWRPTVGPPAQVFVSERNPYFHRVDERGRQLPYIDRLVMMLVERAVIPVKTSTGEADLQARYISFDQVPFLRKNEQLAGFRVFLWNTGVPSTVAIYPNLTTSEPVMRPILQDRRFRQALSLAVNRQEINHILYYGLGLPGPEHRAPEPGRPRGAPERLCAVRPPAGQPPPRRDGPDEARRPRLPAPPGWPAARSHRGDVRRRDGAHGRAGAREGRLGGAGDRAPDPPEPARGIPAPRLLGRGHDERLQRELRVRPPHARHEPGLARPGQPAAAPVAQVGRRTSRARATTARRRRSRPPGGSSSSTSGGSCPATPTSAPASGRRCSTSTPRRCSRSASSEARSSRSS